MRSNLKKIPGLLFLAMLASGYSFAQQTGKTPTTASDTTIVEHLKEDIGDNIPVISLDENDGQDGSAQNISSQLGAGRDPFFNAASFKFNTVRFRIRGYDADNFGTYMNGVPMENLDNGYTPYGLWGGLNDVLRNRDNSLGLKPTPYAFGEIGGINYMDTRASYQRKQTSISYANSNRNYTHRVMLSHSTGLNKKGWAFSLSGSRRWAEEGFTDGTYYDGYSFYAGADKRFNDRHLLSFVFFGTPTENGRQGSSLQEMRDLAGTNYYNPYWGYQNGRKRNSSIGKSFQPFGIITHEWKPTDKTSLLSAVSVTYGNRSTTALDWYNAADPRPDYYRYLPSYQEDPIFREQVYNELKNNVNKRQINWDNLYNANYASRETIHNVDGIMGNNVTGKRSHYIVEERVVNTLRYNLNTTINTSIKENIAFTGGLTYQSQTNNYYKKVNDLLGGDFYVDLNQFGERDFPSNPLAGQNDVNRPNRILKVGDKFGYDYDITIRKASLWMQTTFKFRRLDVFVATEHSYSSFFRYGNVKNGLFLNNSYGKSQTYNFYNSSFKGGVTYKLNGRNYFYANGSYMSRAPFFENAFIAPRTRDFVQDNLKSEEIGTVEGGYAMNSPRVKLRLNGYYTHFKNILDVMTFYNDQYGNFVNYAISGLSKEHMGIEFGAEAKVYKGFSLNAAASVGKYTFGRSNALVTVDNSAAILAKDVIFSNNYRVPTPQQAYTFGVDYRSPKFWFVNLSFNYFDDMWSGINPLRRTYGAVDGIVPGSDVWHNVLDQQKLKAQYTLDFFGGFSWQMNKRFKDLKKRTTLYFNLGVNNLLDNKDIVTGASEQLRFDFSEKNTDKFPPRSFFAYGLNFFASVAIRF